MLAWVKQILHMAKIFNTVLMILRYSVSAYCEALRSSYALYVGNTLFNQYSAIVCTMIAELLSLVHTPRY